MVNREIGWKLFRYVVAIAIGEVYLGIFSLFLGLTKWQSALVLGGGAILIWSILFTFLEVQRIERASRGLPEEFVPKVKRIIVVGSPTGEPYPHHEDHPRSPGMDQGQLTSRWAGNTPLIDWLLLWWHARHIRAGSGSA